MNILVTGANGQLGNEIRLIAVNSSNSYLFTDVEELNITDPKAISQMLKKHFINVVINCAAYTNVDNAEDDIEAADLINNKSVSYLAAACKQVDATFIHVSTDYVFDGSNNIPYTEQMPTVPLGVYGRTKLMGESAVLASECRYILFRTSWLYSQFGNNFVKTMQRLTSERKTLNVVFDQVGTPTYAADLAALICQIIENKAFDKQGIYHFSNEGVCSWYDFAIQIAKLSGNVCDIKPCHSNEYPSRVQRPHFSVLDKSKVKQAFNISIEHWTDALSRYLNNKK